MAKVKKHFNTKKTDDTTKIKPIYVAFICEEDKIKSLAVALTSMLENAGTETQHKINILSSANYSKENKDLLLDFKEKYTCEITLTKVDDINTESYTEIARTVANNDNEIDRYIYLDYNVIVQKDLTELFDLDLGNQAVGGVKDVEINEGSSSVLLIDCGKMRENANIDICNIDLKFNLRARCFYGEKTFNFSPKVTVGKEVIDGFDKRQLREAFRENVIFSYTDEVNPFVTHDCPFVDEWYKHFSICPLTAQGDIKTPLISVIVPVYNVEKYLELCVDSITNQSYKNLEIILIDDGSTDSSGQMCDELASNDTRINVIHKENGGLSSARNSGMDMSTGEYISFVDSDDFIHPKAYSLAMSCFNETPDLDLVEWKAYASKESDVLDKKYTQVKFNKFSDYDSLQQNQEEFIKGTILRSPNSINVWSKLFKKDLISDIRFENGKLNEDVFFTNNYMVNVKKAVVLNLQLHHYLLRGGSITHQIVTDKHLDEFRGFVDRYELLKKHYPELLEITCRKDLAFFYARMKELVEQNKDEDMSIRKALVEIMLTYYDDIVKFKDIPQDIKDDFILAKKDIVGFIEKNEGVKQTETQVIPVVFATDENYAMPLSVTITSLLENANKTTYYDIYVLIDDEFSKEVQNNILILSQIYNNFKIEFISFKQRFDDVAIKTYVTKVTYYRLLISSLLPNVEKCIYLDCDIIVQKDLTTMFNTNIEKYYIAGVRDPYVISTLGENYASKIGLIELNQYVNAGILIFNIKMIRKNNIEKLFLDLIGNEKFDLLDQDIINIVCYDNIKHINLRYNLPPVQFRKEKSNKIIVGNELTNTFGKIEISNAINDSTILHFLSSVKPWENKNSNCADIWWKYYDYYQIKKKVHTENTELPLISVIVPIYNVEEYLLLCVNSIINQSYKNLEIILVDDGSTDNCSKICDNISKKDDRIIVIHKENGGQSSARNTGMDIAKGAYISFIDSDDYIHPQTYSLAVDAFKQNIDLDLVAWGFEITKNQLPKYQIEKFNSIENINIEFNNLDEFCDLVIKYSKYKHEVCNKLFKTSLIKGIRFIPNKFAEDLFFTNEYMFKVNKAGYIDQNLYYYFQRNGSTMNSKFTVHNIDAVDGFYFRHLKVKQHAPILFESSLLVNLERINILLKRIVMENDDIDKKMRTIIVEKMLDYYYDDVMNFDKIPSSIKDGIILAKDNISSYIDKFEVLRPIIRVSQIDDEFSIYKENTVILLGVGQGTKQLLDLMRYHKIDIHYICDSNKDNWGKVLEGIPVISLAQLQQMAQNENIVVQIAVNNMAKNVEEQLSSIGVKAVISFEEAWNVLNYHIKSKLIKNNTSIQNSYQKYKNSSNILEMFKATEYVMNNGCFNEYLFICMTGKTGDNTLMKTFTQNKIPFHFTMHTPEALDLDLLNKLNKKIKITTALRNPISQNLSSLYECIGLTYFTNVICNFGFYEQEKLLFKNGGDVQMIFDNWIDNIDISTTVENFMERFNNNIIDLYKHPFDKEKGYTIIKEGNIEVFVYQLERMNDIVKEMSDWIGQTPFDEWVMGNEASSKWIANSYKQAQKEITFSQEYFDRCYNDPWVQHFYSQEDIEKFKERWRPHIKE